MGEKNVIVKGEKVSYEGLFDAKEFFKAINDWIDSHRYDQVEKKHAEVIKPEQKSVSFEMQSSRSITDYAKIVMTIKINMDDLKDVVVEQDGRKKKLNQGKVSVAIDGFIETDYEHRWETKPAFYFLKSLWEKYVYNPYTNEWKQRVKDDVQSLKTTIKAFLNLFRYTT